MDVINMNMMFCEGSITVSGIPNGAASGCVSGKSRDLTFTSSVSQEHSVRLLRPLLSALLSVFVFST